MLTSAIALTTSERNLEPETAGQQPEKEPTAGQCEPVSVLPGSPSATGEERLQAARANPPRAGPVQFGALRRFLRFPELRERCGIPYSRMHIDRLEKAGRFPKRVQLGENSVAWLEDEIVAWQAERIADRGEAR